MGRRRRALVTAMGDKAYWRRVYDLAPLFYYPLNEPVGTTGANSVRDAMGTYHATPASITFGAAGFGDGLTGAAFGGSSYIDLPEAALRLTINRSEYSIMAWVLAAAQTNKTIFRATTGAGAPNSFTASFRLSDSDTILGDIAGGDGVSRFPNKDINYNNIWVHCVLTQSVANNRSIMYLNGVAGTAQLGAAAANTTVLLDAQCLIGATDKTPSGGITGTLQHVAWFNRELAPAEVLSLYRTPSS